jgi:hypothetical protein
MPKKIEIQNFQRHHIWGSPWPQARWPYIKKLLIKKFVEFDCKGERGLFYKKIENSKNKYFARGSHLFRPQFFGAYYKN